MEMVKDCEILHRVMTTKEIESEFGLPINTVVQDIRRGKIKKNEYRQSGKTWLVTRSEALRLYHNYKKKKK